MTSSKVVVCRIKNQSPTSRYQLINSIYSNSVESQLTDEGVKAMGLIFPVDSQEVDGDTSQHDGQANAAHHRLRVKGEDEQEGPEDEVNDGPDQADL